jgi:hypothetical protein
MSLSTCRVRGVGATEKRRPSSAGSCSSCFGAERRDGNTAFVLPPVTLVVDFNAGRSVMQSANARLSLLSTIELAFQLSDDGASLQKVSLRAADIDLLIATLAHHRATMEPEVPRTLPDLKEVRTALDPNWILHAPATTNNKLLFIRHPGLGWLMFQLPPSEAAELGHGLLSGRSQQIGDQRSLNRPLH